MFHHWHNTIIFVSVMIGLLILLFFPPSALRIVRIVHNLQKTQCLKLCLQWIMNRTWQFVSACVDQGTDLTIQGLPKSYWQCHNHHGLQHLFITIVIPSRFHVQQVTNVTIVIPSVFHMLQVTNALCVCVCAMFLCEHLLWLWEACGNNASNPTRLMWKNLKLKSA